MPRSYFLPKGWQETMRLPQQLIWWVEYAFIGSLVNLFRLLPLRLSMRCAAAVFGFLGPFSRRATKVRNNLMVVRPDAGDQTLEAMTRASFRYVGVAVAELASLAQIWRERDQRIEWVVLPGAVAPSPEVCSVFVTAHVGAWQLTPLIGPFYDVTIPVIYAPEDNPYVDRKLAALRQTFGGPLVSRDGGIRVLMRALDAGQSIGLTVDTRMDAGELLPFFGEDALTNTAPARLALRYQCDLVPVRAERLPRGRYRVTIYPPVKPTDTGANVAVQARDMSVQTNHLFEQWIRETSDQWLCLKRRWPKTVYRHLASR